MEELANFENTLINGELFYELFPNSKFIRVFTTYGVDATCSKEGIHECKINQQSANFVNGGIRFGIYPDQLSSLLKTAYDAKECAFVEIPLDAQIYIEKDKILTDRIIVQKKQLIKDLDIWKNVEFCEDIVSKGSACVGFIDLSTVSHDAILKMLDTDGYLIKHFDNPTIEMCMTAMKKNAYTFNQIKNPSEELCLYAMQRDSYVSIPVNKWTYKICLVMVKQKYLGQLAQLLKDIPEIFKSEELLSIVVSRCGILIGHIEPHLQTEKICIDAIKNNPDAFFKIHPDNITHSIKLEAVKSNPMILEKIEDQDEELCLAAVENKGIVLQYAQIKTKKVCDAAFENDVHAIEFIPDSTEEMKLKAIQVDPALMLLMDEYKDNPNDELKLIMVKRRPSYILEIENPTEEMLIEAVTKDGKLLQKINPELQTEDICVAAIKSCVGMFQYVMHKTHAVYMAAIAQDGLLLKTVPKEEQSVEMCITAVKKNHNASQYVLIDDDKLEEFYISVIRTNPMFIKSIPIDKLTPDICLEAVKRKGDLFKVVPEHLRTDEIYLMAIQEVPHVIVEIKKEFDRLGKKVPEDFYYEAIKGNPHVIHNIPQAVLNSAMCLLVVKSSGNSLPKVPKHLRTHEIYMEAINNHPHMLDNVIKDMIDDKIDLNSDIAMNYYRTAVNKNGYTIRHIQNPSLEIVLMAVKKEPKACTFINDMGFINLKKTYPDIYIRMIEANPAVFEHITEQTVEVCLTAISKNPMLFRHIKLQDPILCIHASLINPKIIPLILDLDKREICEKFITSEIMCG